MKQASAHRVLLLLAFGVAGMGGCDSHADTVCESVGDCSQGGDHDWIQQCQDEAKLLEQAADRTACRDAFDDYYRCADDHYACHGNLASFPSCDPKRAALSECFAKAASGTACAELATRRAACVLAADGGGSAAEADPNPAPACDATRECQARCYLDHTADACTPDSAELDALSQCTASCPP